MAGSPPSRARRLVTTAFALAGTLAFSQPCLVTYSFSASTPPTNGTYACGQTVTFCFTLNSWNTTNANWFHGIVANFGPGWDLSTLVPGPPPPTVGASGGNWNWYNSVQGTAGTNIGPQGPGFFFDLNNDGNAGNNFGDFATGPWTFCWTISVLSGPACINGLGLGVSINTFGDSETGSWGSAACGGDPIVPSAPAVIQACSVNAGTGGPFNLCSSSPPLSLSTGLGGNPDPGGTWTDPGGIPHSGILDPATDVSGNYTYTVSSVAPPCSGSAVLSVTIEQQPSAGTDGSIVVCASDAPFNLIGQLGGAPTAGGSWTGPGGASTGTFDPSTDVAGVYNYLVTGAPPCVNASATVTVTVNPSPNAGSDGLLAICSNGPATALINLLGGTPSVGGTWDGPAGPMSGVYDPALDASGVYTYTVAGVAPCPSSSASVTVTENPLPSAGSNASATLCSTAPATPLVNLLGGTPDPGGSWTDPSGAAVGGMLDPAALPPSGSYTYTVLGAAPCPNATAEVNLTLNIQLSAGTDNIVNLCNASVPIDLFATLSGSPDPGGNWNGPSGPIGSTTFTPGVSPPGVYTYGITSLPPCVNSSATVTVNVSAQPNAGVSTNTSACSNSAPASIFTDLGPSAQPGGSWTDPIGNPFSGVFNPAINGPGGYTYTIAGTPPCPTASATVTMSIVQASDPGTNSTLSLCTSNPLTNLFNALGGAPQAGGTWTSPSGTAISGTINPATTASGNYTYTLPASGPCPAASASVAVTVTPQPSAGTPGATNLCSNSAAPFNLITALAGSPSPGGNWTAPTGLPHGPSFSASGDAPGIYTYTVNAPPPCTSASSTVTVTVVQAPDAGTGGAMALCANAGPVAPFAWLGGAPDAGGSWTSPSGAPVASVDPATAASGAYTYTVPGSAPCAAAQAVVLLTIDVPPQAGADGALNLCANASPASLGAYLSGAQAGGSWQGPSGAATGTFTPGSNVPGIYTYTVNGTGACAGQSDQGTVTVQVNPLPQPAFSVDVDRGCTPLQVQFTMVDPAGILSATWSFGDGFSASSIASAYHTYTSAGSFDVQLNVTDANGCSGSIVGDDVVLASSGPTAYFLALPLRVSANDPTTVITHTAADEVTYTWTIDGLSFDTSGTFQWTFDPPTVGEREICLTATDSLDCANVLCQRVLVDDDLTIYVANAFTPNDDDKNEVFRPSVIGMQEDWYEFMVFNRWGLLVFSTTDPSEGWNGGMNNAGEILPQDVYVWMLRAKDQFTPEKAELIGTVTLLK
ncbi:MAG: gliding motility-associated C-terminal domain-containing protein [Flavobacteriales bacterium]|nr:gliding motility-associated C-terminal domain-containing protein [Flavobacteriales bacterium]